VDTILKWSLATTSS